MATLILTTDEQKMFHALSAPLQEGWTIEPETLTDHYETGEQIRMRHYMADLKPYPQVKAIADKIAAGQDIGEMSLDDIPDDFQKEFFFTIGARGVAAIMRTILAKAESDEDLRALEDFSAIRHKLLEINASSSRS